MSVLKPVYSNHLHHDFVKEKTSIDGYYYVNHNGTELPSGLTAVILHYLTHAVPMAGALMPKVGIPLRFVTDLLESSSTEKQTVMSESLLRSVFSGVSAYTIFFAPLYCKHVEVVRSLVMHLRDLCQLSPNQDGKQLQKQMQIILHLMIDLVNLAVLTMGGLEFQLASHFLQLCVGLLDAKAEWGSGSYLGTAVHLALSVLRLSSLITTGHKLYQASHPKIEPAVQRGNQTLHQNLNQTSTSNTTLTSHPCSGSIPEAAALYQEGTGSEELKKLTVLGYLGREHLSGDLFLVQDEDGKTKVLKRFFNESEKIEQSCVYALFSDMCTLFTVLFWPIALPIRILGAYLDLKALMIKDALTISELKDPNVLQVFKMIQNKYDKLFLTQKGETVVKSIKDTYVLMEHFEGVSLGKWTKNLPIEAVQKIVSTLCNIANSINYFFNRDNLEEIKISGDVIKVLPFHFVKLDDKNNDWSSCLRVYDTFYNFCAKLAQRLPEKEKWMRELDLIFNLQDLVKKYRESSTEAREVLKSNCEKIFNPALLKATLAKVQALFCAP